LLVPDYSGRKGGTGWELAGNLLGASPTLSRKRQAASEASSSGPSYFPFAHPSQRNPLVACRVHGLLPITCQRMCWKEEKAATNLRPKQLWCTKEYVLSGKSARRCRANPIKRRFVLCSFFTFSCYRRYAIVFSCNSALARDACLDLYSTRHMAHTNPNATSL
jgi:hypothetical protein